MSSVKPIALEAYEALAARYALTAPDKAENGYIEHPAMRAQLGDVQHPLGAYLAYRPRSAFGVHDVEARWDDFGGMPVIVPDHYRSFEEIIAPLLKAGFRLTTFLETRPPSSLREKDPYRYELYNALPTFLCIEARKER